ncbi:uncharacterized protein [Spinacia oleracea]|uniref:Uncharacterized protein n=1 Tax=Spinacia oleracea TaxID=3562 RepID=A0A9R0JLY5_SPIOL|nr:uncharacterized protein LOC110779400 [Spinacia oleracea]
MASVQQADHVMNQLSDKEKAAIEEAMKEAELSFLTRKDNNNNNNNNSKADERVLVTGVVKNLFPKQIKFYGYSIWQGSFVDLPPQNINANGIGAFAYKANVNKCNGDLIYCSLKESNTQQLGWLLAFNKVDKINKVYVEAGTLDRIEKIPFEVISEKVAASGNISRYWDSDTGASAAAEIRNFDDYMAFVGVTFDQYEGISQHS